MKSSSEKKGSSSLSILVAGFDGPQAEAIALALAGKGIRLALHYRSDPALAYETAAEIAEQQAIVLPLYEKLTNAETAQRLIQRVIDDFGRIDVVIADAQDEGISFAEALAAEAARHLRKSHPFGKFILFHNQPALADDQKDRLIAPWAKSPQKIRLTIIPAEDSPRTQGISLTDLSLAILSAAVYAV